MSSENWKEYKMSREKYLVGHQIRSPKVTCIDHNNQNLGLIPTYQALKIAEENNLDLVQVNNGDKNVFPTCKILNYGKFKYELSKNKKAAAKKQKESEIKIKEIKFRPTTDLNDLKLKAKHAEDFIKDNYKVKISMVFKGREVSHQEIAMETFNTFISFVSNVKISGTPSMEGKNFIAMIEKNK